MRVLAIISAAVASASIATPLYAQEAQTFVPLTGPYLRNALVGHYMQSVGYSNIAEKFDEHARWSMSGGREVVYGTWELKKDAYCVTMFSGRHWCAQLSHEEGDIYVTRYLDAATGIMHGRVRLAFDHAGGPDLGKDDPRNAPRFK
ncbi:MAG: hypothetical protein EON93_04010 [Burkholderiales bacterium]|nr:MAG: hypothetical protein EON93_04010 [Burkholderiales bacterium]